MDPLIVSAKFAAFVWFVHDKPDTMTVQRAAGEFAKENWLMFLPNAHEGLGRLLIQISTPAANSSGFGDLPRSGFTAACRPRSDWIAAMTRDLVHA